MSVGLDSVWSKIGGAFTASADYKKAEGHMSNIETGFATASAQCTLFTIAYAIPPCLSETLEIAFGALPLEPTDEQLNEFIDTFGTHAIRKVNMGSKYVITATFNKKEAEQ